jgi:hypothetical protein
MKHLLFFCFIFFSLPSFSQTNDGIDYTTGYKKISEISDNIFLSNFFKSNCRNLSEYQIVSFGDLVDSLNCYKNNNLTYKLEIFKINKPIEKNTFNYVNHSFPSDNTKTYNPNKLLFGDWFVKEGKYFFTFYLVN